MHHRYPAAILFLCVALLASAPRIWAQDHSTETKATVPALKAFHTVIYEIWHGAWPKKDTNRLVELLPKVEAGVRSVVKAKLPGILRERQESWEEGLVHLKAAAWEYRTAVEEKDTQAILDAAEILHTRYEQLVRAIRPALKELEDFHTVLYMLYHYYMPGDSLDRMKSSALALKEKMVALDKAVLPERLQSKEEAFASARAKLSRSVDALASIAPAGDLASIKKSVIVLHTDYQALEKVFE
jgi:hypothetical protein